MARPAVACVALALVVSAANVRAATWSKTLNMSGKIVTGWAMTPDGSILTTYLEGGACAAKITSAGDMQFARCYGSVAWGYGKVAAAPDNGFFLFGTFRPADHYRFAWVIRASANGEPMWARLYDLEEAADIASVLGAADGGAILCGGVGDTGERGKPRRSFVVKIRRDGAVEWARAFDSPGPDRFFVALDSGDGFVAAGGTQYGALVVKLTKDGRIRWQRSLATRGQVVDATIGGDGALYVSGLSGEFRPAGSYWLAKFDMAGVVKWTLIARDSPAPELGRIVPGPAANEVTAIGTRFGPPRVIDFITVSAAGTVQQQRSVTLAELVTPDEIPVSQGRLAIVTTSPSGHTIHLLDKSLAASACLEASSNDPAIVFKPGSADRNETIEHQALNATTSVETLQTATTTRLPALSACQPSTPPMPTVAATPAPSKMRVLEQEEENFRNQVAALLVRRDFDSLDGMATELERSGAEFTRGGSKLSYVFEVLTKPRPEYGNDAAHFALLEQWKAARPQSFTAAIALAESYLHAAWRARSSAASSLITDKASEQFNTWLRRAATSLSQARFADAHPDYRRVQILIAGPQCVDVKRLAYDADSRKMRYDLFFRTAANYLLPRWCGSPEEYRAYAEYAAAAMASPAEGDALYARMAFDAAILGDSVFDLYKFDWPRVQRGLRVNVNRAPDWLPYQHRLAFMAWRAGDRPVAREMFERLGPAWNDIAAQVWVDPNNFAKAKEWVTTSDRAVRAAPETSWIESPPERWPAIALQNDVALSGGGRKAGTGAFLVSTPKGVVAISSLTFLLPPPSPTEFQGNMSIADLRRMVVSWAMSYRQDITLQMTGILELQNRPQDVRGIVMTIASAKHLPVQTLVPRPTPLGLDERVFLVGCKRGLMPCDQVVYQGRANPYASNNKFGIVYVTFEGAGISLADYIGYPIIDEQGRAAGVVASPAPTPHGPTWNELAFIEETQMLLDMVR